MARELVRLKEYTDPACPYAFSASPEMLALSWFYGDQIGWERHLVVLSETAADNSDKGLTPEFVVQGSVSLGERYGMPLSRERPERLIVSLPVDMAVKAVQLHAPDLVDRLLRALQVAWHSQRRMIDEPNVLADVAGSCGVEPEQLARWVAEEVTEAALAEDKSAARAPVAAASGPLDRKLGGPHEERRYSCPSIEVRAVAEPERVLVAPGMQSLDCYEVLLANAEPRLQRRAAAVDAREALEWADWPLATVEVAHLMGAASEQAHESLEAVGASCDEGYWTLD